MNIPLNSFDKATPTISNAIVDYLNACWRRFFAVVDDRAYIVVYTWVGRLFWFQSSRNHVLSNSKNVGDIVGIQMIALWQTAHEYAFGVSNQRGLENRTMTIFETIFIAIESVISVYFSLNSLYQIPVCINCISKKNIHDIVSQNLKSFMCLFYWHAVSQFNTNGNMIKTTANDICIWCCFIFAVDKYFDQNIPIMRNSNFV